jgi:hypothetical protein
VAEFRTVYEYPVKIAGRAIYEHRLTRLRLHERLSEVESLFSTDMNYKSAKPMADFPYEIAIGLVTQNAGAHLTLEPAAGLMAVYEDFNGLGLGTGVLLDSANSVRMDRLPAMDPDKAHEHALAIVKIDAKGRLRYRTGFAWAGDGEITTAAAWLDYLRRLGIRQR